MVVIRGLRVFAVGTEGTVSIPVAVLDSRLTPSDDSRHRVTQKVPCAVSRQWRAPSILEACGFFRGVTT